MTQHLPLRLWLLCWLLVMLPGPFLERQEQPRGWSPRQVSAIRGVNAAQRAEAMGTIDKIERILKAVPELATSDGYEIVPVIAGGSQQVGPGFDAAPLAGSVIEYGIGLRFYRPTRAIAGEGLTCVSVTVNKRSEGRLRDAAGRLIYIESDRAKPSTNANISDSRVPQGATQVYGELWNVPRERSSVEALFVTAGDLPWKPVSREEFYNANLLEQEGAKGEKVAEIRDALKKTPYQDWLERAPQRKKDRDAALAQLVGVLPPADLEKSRMQMEASERDVTERLKKEEPQHRETMSQALKMSSYMGDNMRADLAAMSPAERQMPTYINNALTHGPIGTGWRLTADEAPPAWRVLTPNYDFYRARRSPVEVRSVSVIFGMSLTCLSPKIQQALWQAYHKLDWSAFNALLEQPR